MPWPGIPSLSLSLPMASQTSTTNTNPQQHDPSKLFIKGTWPLPYTFERVNQALHRASDDPIESPASLSICGIGKAINTVAILHNVIQDKQRGGQDWTDYSIESLNTATVSNSEKPRTQLSFTLVKADGAGSGSAEEEAD